MSEDRVSEDHVSDDHVSDDLVSEERVRYRLASDVRFRVVGGEGVVVLQDAGEVLVVNGVGARVLELLDLRREPLPGREGRSAEELIARLLDEFDTSDEDIERDVRGFLKEIREAGVVLEIAEGSGDHG